MTEVPTELICVAYRSTATGPWSFDDRMRLVRTGAARNIAAGITARLFARGDRFVHLLEGRRDPIASMLARIAADPRHRDMEQIMACERRDRLFPEWPLAITDASNLPERDWSDVTRSMTAIPRSGVQAALRLRRLAAQGITTPEYVVSARIPITQERARQSVERVMIAARMLLLRDGPAGVTLPAVAAEAGVSLPTLYRYFGNTDELFSAMALRLASVRLEGVRIVLASGDFNNEAQMIRAMASHVFQHFGRYDGSSPETTKFMIPYLQGVLHEPIALCAADMLAAMRRCGMPSARWLKAEWIEFVLSGLMSASLTLLRINPRNFPRERVTSMAVEQVVGGLDAAARSEPAADAEPTPPRRSALRGRTRPR